MTVHATSPQRSAVTSSVTINEAIHNPTLVLERTATPDLASVSEVEEALALTVETGGYFAYWQARVTERRNRCVLRLWELGWSQGEIAARMGSSVGAVHEVIAEMRARASEEMQAVYARRAAEEFAEEAAREIGNLFAVNVGAVA